MENVTQSSSEDFSLERLGWLFYIADTKRTTFKTEKDVPDILNQVRTRFKCSRYF